MIHLHEGPDLGRTTEQIEKRKSPAPSGIWTHDLSDTRRVLYRCATTTAFRKLWLIFFWILKSLNFWSILFFSTGSRSSSSSLSPFQLSAWSNYLFFPVNSEAEEIVIVSFSWLDKWCPLGSVSRRNLQQSDQMIWWKICFTVFRRFGPLICGQKWCQKYV